MNDQAQETGVYPAKPARLAWWHIREKAEKFAEETGFKIGDWVDDHIVKVGGKVEYFSHGVGAATEFRNFEKFDYMPRDKHVKHKFYISVSGVDGRWKNTRVNFFLARLLAHHVLHSPEGKKIFVPYACNSPNVACADELYWETYAFAQDLTMPRDVFMKKWKSTKKNIYLMVGIFNIEPMAIALRLRAISACDKISKTKWITNEKQKKK